MQDISRVKYRKNTRRIVLNRRNIEKIPEKTVKYIHKSAIFAGMISDMGIERIGTYVQSMADHTKVLAEMINTGIINDRILNNEVASIGRESERTGADISLIGNSLIRFLHTDYEGIKNALLLQTRMEKTRTPENEQEVTGLPGHHPADTPKTALVVGDSRE